MQEEEVLQEEEVKAEIVLNCENFFLNSALNYVFFYYSDYSKC